MNNGHLLQNISHMEESGEQCTVVFALIASPTGRLTIFAKTTVHCSPEPEFLNFHGALDSIQGTNSAGLCSLAGLYDNPRCLALIDGLKIPAQIPL